MVRLALLCLFCPCLPDAQAMEPVKVFEVGRRLKPIILESIPVPLALQRVLPENERTAEAKVGEEAQNLAAALARPETQEQVAASKMQQSLDAAKVLPATQRGKENEAHLNADAVQLAHSQQQLELVSAEERASQPQQPLANEAHPEDVLQPELAMGERQLELQLPEVQVVEKEQQLVEEVADAATPEDVQQPEMAAMKQAVAQQQQQQQPIADGAHSLAAAEQQQEEVVAFASQQPIDATQAVEAFQPAHGAQPDAGTVPRLEDERNVGDQAVVSFADGVYLLSSQLKGDMHTKYMSWKARVLQQREQDKDGLGMAESVAAMGMSVEHGKGDAEIIQTLEEYQQQLRQLQATGEQEQVQPDVVLEAQQQQQQQEQQQKEGGVALQQVDLAAQQAQREADLILKIQQELPSFENTPIPPQPPLLGDPHSPSPPEQFTSAADLQAGGCRLPMQIPQICIMCRGSMCLAWY